MLSYQLSQPISTIVMLCANILIKNVPHFIFILYTIYTANREPASVRNILHRVGTVGYRSSLTLHTNSFRSSPSTWLTLAEVPCLWRRPRVFRSSTRRLWGQGDSLSRCHPPLETLWGKFGYTAWGICKFIAAPK